MAKAKAYVKRLVIRFIIKENSADINVKKVHYDTKKVSSKRVRIVNSSILYICKFS